MENLKHRGIHKQQHTKWNFNSTKAVPRSSEDKSKGGTTICYSEIYRSKFYTLNSLPVWTVKLQRCYGEKLLEVIFSTIDCPEPPADVEDAEQTSFGTKTSLRDNTEAVINNAAVKWLLQELNKQG